MTSRGIPANGKPSCYIARRRESSFPRAESLVVGQHVDKVLIQAHALDPGPIIQCAMQAAGPSKAATSNVH